MTTDVELRTGSYLYSKTKNNIFRDHGGKVIFAVTIQGNKSIIGKIKVGVGSEIIYCGDEPCDVNCYMFTSAFYATDLTGTKAYFKPLSY